ncbi:di-trans,poly-cis-decaprenylcistransferase [Desulfovibrio sp. OttesenSCG-928-A18]|nr:di-trans,poly-cis-decaprenylcistransferase [Desulfovibrio sp. OttesenSCG-928-A18]
MDYSAALPADAAEAEALPLPRHVAVIMDGNGRWAKARGLTRSDGHKAGTEAARAIVEECLAIGIPYLTLYTFSRENWSRPPDEVRFLFDMLVEFITRELPLLEKRGVRLSILGEMAELPFTARKTLQHACSRTAAGNRMTLNLALNYSGREEITRACRRYMESGAPPARLTPETLANFLYTGGQPDPDLLIRTSGELRISNFLLFQAAYSEFYFCDTLWPDFTPAELHKALVHYAKRSRRFGGVKEAG